MRMVQMQVITNHVYFNNFGKNQRNETKILFRKCNSLIKDGRL